jgi:hypothetical protein
MGYEVIEVDYEEYELNALLMLRSLRPVEQQYYVCSAQNKSSRYARF